MCHFMYSLYHQKCHIWLSSKFWCSTCSVLPVRYQILSYHSQFAPPTECYKWIPKNLLQAKPTRTLLTVHTVHRISYKTYHKLSSFHGLTFEQICCEVAKSWKLINDFKKILTSRWLLLAWLAKSHKHKSFWLKLICGAGLCVCCSSSAPACPVMLDRKL